MEAPSSVMSDSTPILEEPYPVVTPSTIADLGVEALFALK